MKATLILLLISLSFNTWLHAQGGMSASPLKLEFTATPSNSQNHIVVVTNPGTSKLEINTSINDWYRDSTGDINTPSAGSLETSCSPWIKIYPSTHFTLEPGESKEITISLLPDPEAKPIVRNSMVFFSQMNPQRGKTKEGISIDLTVRIGIQIYYIPPGLTHKNIDIINFKYIPSKDSITGSSLNLHLQNTGALVADGKVEWDLVNLKTGKKTTLPNSSFYTLPGALRIISIPLTSSLTAGKYSATALIDFGRNEELKIGELEFNYLPQ